MESPFSTLVFVFFGFGISFCAIFVQSQSEDGATNVASLPPEHPPPPPPEHPPPPPPEHPPPPPPEHPPPPPPEHHPPPHHSPNQLNYRNKPSRSPPPRRPNYRPPPPLPPPSHSNNVNTGKKVGLLFVGLASILQIGVVGFLVFKRRQLLKLDDRY